MMLRRQLFLSSYSLAWELMSLANANISKTCSLTSMLTSVDMRTLSSALMF